MGVSGSGKTTIASGLAKRLHWTFEDGDKFHPKSNVEKMSAGHPLTDEDRWPWLNAIADEIERVCTAGEHAVIACSALKRAYRDILVRDRKDVRIVYLTGTRELIARRLALRKNHFMPPDLLESQFKTLEAPGADENPVTVSIDASVEAIVDDIVRKLGPDPGESRCAPKEPPMSRIALVVSDVDGTLVTHDKRLTDGARRAVQRLHDAGIGFTITSSRPPVGMRFLIEPLGITLPIGPFNGSSIVDIKLKPIEQHLIPAAAARRSIEVLEQFGVDVWLFTNEQWIIRRDDGKYVPHERHTIKFDPTFVDDFTPFIATACKIVGASADAALLERCEIAMQKALGTQASAIRSQSYYLDITPPGHDKGTFVETMTKRLGISTNAVATIGDMRNDLAMFKKSGLSIAMGNATDDVKKHASHVTGSNEEEGFAGAIDFILNRNTPHIPPSS
jgi:carbohydrate kinase (thermoresistant glucokinase family)/Cof subfamily protein (haloacid dehalogenase superfamily)